LAEEYQQYQKQMVATWSHVPNSQDTLRALQNPATFAAAIFLLMFLFFLLLSLASVAGGALGARFSNNKE
jgi:hypothetical protein